MAVQEKEKKLQCKVLHCLFICVLMADGMNDFLNVFVRASQFLYQ